MNTVVFYNDGRTIGVKLLIELSAVDDLRTLRIAVPSFALSYFGEPYSASSKFT